MVTHYNDVIMDTIASQITSLTIVYSIVYSDADKGNHQSSASLAFVRVIHRGPVNSPHKWTVTRKMFPFDDVIMQIHWLMRHHTQRLMSYIHIFTIFRFIIVIADGISPSRSHYRPSHLWYIYILYYILHIIRNQRFQKKSVIFSWSQLVHLLASAVFVFKVEKGKSFFVPAIKSIGPIARPGEHLDGASAPVPAQFPGVVHPLEGSLIHLVYMVDDREGIHCIELFRFTEWKILIPHAVILCTVHQMKYTRLAHGLLLFDNR